MAKGSVGKGWSLVWRHQKILWWLFFVNVVLAYVSTLAPRMVIGKILDHSLYSERLARGFDLAVFSDLASKPEFPMIALLRGSMLMAWVYFAFVLFVTGGILVAYREDRKLSTGEFFEASGDYFWRMLRLVLMSLIPFGAVGGLMAIVLGISGTSSSESPNAKLGFYILVTGYVISMLLVLIVRLWFDVAQVRAVAQDERGMFRNLMRSFVITFKDFFRLFRIYFSISLFGWVVLGLGIYAWTRLSGNHVFRVFVLAEIILFAQLLTRLWQRAASVAWYGEYAEVHPAAAVEFTTPKPAEIVEPAPAQPVVPGTDSAGPGGTS